uniref:C2 domain-containing protein n=1 Tax=Leersia perrieri TaxID=77586 RepID=A0A0D9XSP6_9ORYZ
MSPTAGAGRRRVTVRSISCRGVKAFVPFQKPPLYVAVSLAGRREKTTADSDGGENPDWESAVFAFDLDAGGEGGGAAEIGDGMLQFEVKAQVPLLANKLVGKVSVPLADLAGAGGGHVSYQVCAPDGKANGKLSFSYAVTGGGEYQPPPPQDSTFYCAPPPLSPPSSAPYPSPAMASYPPLPSLSAPLLYPPPPPPDSHFQAQNFPPNSSYPPPPPHPSQYISSYPPPPQSQSNYYPPPPPAGYPTAANFPSPASTYPPPPAPPESGSSQYPPLPRTAPCCDSSVDRALPPSYMSPPVHDAYPPPATWQHDEAAGAPYNCYPQPGNRYL